MRPMPTPEFSRRPIRWPVSQNLQTQIQQLKAASTGAPLPGNSVLSPNLPQAVLGINTSIKSSGSLRTVTVSFTRGPDALFQQANVYLKQGSGSPILVASSPTSPITFTTTKTVSPSSIVVQTQGNWGSLPLSASLGKAIHLG
jgi:hypothetical protein